MLTNTEVQAKLTASLELLKNRDSTPQGDLALAILTYLKASSASGNDIPGLRGLGLEEALAFSEALEANPTGKVTLSSKLLAKALQVGER